MSRNVVRH
jgi:hypothetical protein